MIKADVDLSNQFGPARQQGMRPTCLAFTASDLNAAAHLTGELSVEFLCHHAASRTTGWQPNHGFTVDSILHAVANPGQPVEAAYPYLTDTQGAPMRSPPAGLGQLFFRKARFRNLTCAKVIQHVGAGEVVGVVVAVTASLYHPEDGIIAFDPYVVPNLYHALVVVGLGTHTSSGERCVLVRNSWGVEWSSQGYAWMPEEHLTLHLIEGFLV